MAALAMMEANAIIMSSHLGSMRARQARAVPRTSRGGRHGATRVEEGRCAGCGRRQEAFGRFGVDGDDGLDMSIICNETDN